MSPNVDTSFHPSIVLSSTKFYDSDEAYIPPLTSKFDLIPEPTPIAMHNIEIVDKVRLEDTRYETLLQLFQEEPLLKQGSTKRPLQFSFSFDEPMKPLKRQRQSQQDSVTSDDVGKSHSEKWCQRFEDLVQFRKEHGHCLVPLDWPENPPLAHWIKHQRCQYKAKQDGKHSTLTPARQRALEELGFVWDSHRATWDEKFNELSMFQSMNGHCNVPTKFKENSKLSTWMKCQRRQYKLFLQGKKSHMTHERISKLSSIGFVWFPRQRSLMQSTPLILQETDHCIFDL